LFVLLTFFVYVFRVLGGISVIVVVVTGAAAAGGCWWWW
jgi:hypothetical protein